MSDAGFIWIDAEEQVIQCQVCGRLVMPALPVPLAKFEQVIDLFVERHQHRELSPQERAQAAVIWRAESDAG